MSNVTRRTFLGSSLAAVGGSLLVSADSQAKGLIGRQKAIGRPLGANDRIRVGVAGIRGQGGSHIVNYAQMKDQNVELLCLIDPDSRLFEPRAKVCEDKGGYRPKYCVQDVRYALDDKDLDGLSIATPNHWHALMTIWACQAGKDVLVEKPMSHNVHEGRIVVETARKYNRMVQHGTQRRCEREWAHAIAAIKSGKLGKLKIARGICYRNRPSIGWKPHTQPPKELDYNMWLGPAPYMPFHENRVHYNWHWLWETGNGDIGNQGVHQMDVASWGIHGCKLPRSVISIAGMYGYNDQRTIPNTQVAFMDFGDVQLIFEVRALPTEGYRGTKVGNIFHLEEGDVIEAKWYPKGSTEPAPLPDVEFTFNPCKSKHDNWIQAMRSRKVSDLNGDILEGHYSSALGHLALISHQLGGKVPFDPRPEGFDADQIETIERMEQHLVANGVELKDNGYTLGRKLVIDEMSETIVDDPEANALLTRHYRKPFVVPDQA